MNLVKFFLLQGHFSIATVFVVPPSSSTERILAGATLGDTQKPKIQLTTWSRSRGA